MGDVTTLEEIVSLLVPVHLALLRDLDGAVVDDAQPRSLVCMLWIVSGFHDHFVDLQPEVVELWEPTGDRGLELDVRCVHRLLPLLDVEVGTSACPIVVGFGMGRNGCACVSSPTVELALVV
jgi:hypothetical protein